MKISRTFSLGFVLLAAFSLAGGTLAAARRARGLPVPTAAAAPTSVPLPLSGEGPWVVRAYYRDPALVAEVAQIREPWEVQPKAGYIVLDVGREQAAWLQRLGFRLEVDPGLTQLLNTPSQAIPGQATGIPGYPCYRTVEETYASAQSLASQHPNLASWVDIGNTWEKDTPAGLSGYDISVLQLTNKAKAGPKPKLFIMSSIHAREYTPAELNTRFAEYLLDQYDQDPDVTWLLDDNEIHLLLQANPDGRKHAESGSYWRKNTDNNYCSDTSSRGADLNRNFSFQWACCGGSSGSACSETYRGPYAGSEPETRAVQSYVRSQFPDQRGPALNDPAPLDAMGIFIDLHSYSQLVLWPWGFTSSLPPNADGLQTLGRKFAYFNHYHPEQAIGLYPTDGTTDDFAYGELGLAAYTFELGNRFFQDCSTFENTILPQNLPALLYAAKAARSPYRTPSGPDVTNLALSPGGVEPGTPVSLTASLDDTRYSNSNGPETTQNIAAAAVYLDVPPWDSAHDPLAIPLAPADGAYDSGQEDAYAVLDTQSLASGRHTLYVRGQDTAGNWGAVSATFLYILDAANSPHFNGTVREAYTNRLLQAKVQAGFFNTTSDAGSGVYDLPVISGTYNLQASAPDHLPAVANGLTISGTQTITQDFILEPTCSLLDNDAENGSQGWSANGWVITTENAHSPQHSWTESPGGNYSPNQDVYLTSPPLDLQAFHGTSLNFWHSYDIEPGTNERYDYGAVEFSTNGGATWHEVAAYSGYDNTTWSAETLSLHGLDGAASAEVRFHFHADSDVEADGWHIDDIDLRAAGEACLPYLRPAAAFSSNAPQPAGRAVSFSNVSRGALPLEFLWDFGDGAGISSAQDPVYTYTLPGNYTVTLGASNPWGSDAISKTLTISACIPLQDTTLTQTSSGAPVRSQVVQYQAVFGPPQATPPFSYQVDFNDGTPLLSGSAASSYLELEHSFTTSGTFSASLTAWNCPLVSAVSDSVETVIAPRHGITVTPGTSALSSPPGSVVTHTILLTNAGDQTDIFSLTLSAGNWPSQLSTPWLALDPGSSAALRLRVELPAGAAAGSQDARTLVIQSSFSSGSPGVMYPLNVTIPLETSAWWRAYLVLIPE